MAKIKTCMNITIYTMDPTNNYILISYLCINPNFFKKSFKIIVHFATTLQVHFCNVRFPWPHNHYIKCHSLNYKKKSYLVNALNLVCESCIFTSKFVLLVHLSIFVIFSPIEELQYPKKLTFLARDE